MIDVECKSLRLMQYNITVLDSLLNSQEFLRKFIGEPTFIQDWSPNKRIGLYYEIANRVIDKGIINSFYKTLMRLDILDAEETDCDIMMFYSVCMNFRDFFKKIYDIYLLDQLYYILVNVSLDEVLEYKNGFKTGSYDESINFGLVFEQSSLLDNEFKRYDQNLYDIKMLLRGNIESLLEKTEYQNKRRKLLEILRGNRKKSPYFGYLIELLESFKRDNVRKRMRTKEVDKNQMTLI